MINQNTINAANSYIVSQAKHADKTSWQLNRIICPFVTISREAGAGGTSLGEKLVEYLNYRDNPSDCKWTLFDKNLIEKVIEDYNLPGAFRHFLTEERIPELQSVFETLMGLHPGINKLAKKTCNTIFNLASMGNVVIIGRGANIINKNLPGGFHVRLIAEREWKIKNIQTLVNMSRKEAIKYIDEEDMRRKEYVKKLFNKNVEDPLMYDMILKASSVPISEAAEIIGSSVQRTQYHQSVNA
jgi:cytidylate kinase